MRNQVFLSKAVLKEEEKEMSYVDDVLAQMKEKDAHEPEFLQVLTEILDSLRPIIEANEENTERKHCWRDWLSLEKVVYSVFPGPMIRARHTSTVAGEFSSTAHRPVQGWYPLPSHPLI